MVKIIGEEGGDDWRSMEARYLVSQLDEIELIYQSFQLLAWIPSFQVKVKRCW